MRLAALASIAVGLCLAVFVVAICVPIIAEPAPAGGLKLAKLVVKSEMTEEQPLRDACFAPGTPSDYMARMQQRFWGERSLDYELGARWSHTATNGYTGTSGRPITLTYSFVSDGTLIRDLENNQVSSSLFATLTAQFGSEAAWKAKFAQIFAEWSRVTGVHYVYEPNDDGATFMSASGETGVRGDVRIGSVPLDGPSNVLAFDYFPDYGDMVLDADEDWADPSQNYIFMRNILSHEHGHGLGLSHVCPISSTKLLEPFYTPAFDGPQHDDIRAAQRNYGDSLEPNNTAALASVFGTITSDSSISNIGLDHLSDVDWIKFAIPAGKGMTLTLDPVGSTYLSGPQNQQTGACGAGTSINSRAIMNLDLSLYNAAGTTLLLQSNTHATGDSERIFHYPVSQNGDSFCVKISAGSGTDDCQLYKLKFDLFNLSDPFLNVNPLKFDTTQLNQPVVRSTYFVNPSGFTLTGTASVTGPFTVQPSTSFTIPAHDSLQLQVTYSAVTLGSQTGALQVQHSGPGGNLSANLSGTAVNAYLTFPAGVDVTLPNVEVGGLDSARTPIRANGNVSLQITSITTTPPFSIALALPVTLAPTQSLFLWARFSPTAIGAVDGMMIITYTGSSSPDTLFLHGVGIASGVDDARNNLPNGFRLEQNYPNPFNPSTMIAFELPKSSPVKMQVFDIEGRLVQELVSATLDAGRHQVRFDGSALSSGVYLYRFTAPEFSAMGKMVLLK
jgi:hypothetical protein